MKPSRFDHDAALRAIYAFKAKHPTFDDRAPTPLNTPEHRAVEAICILSDVAGMYACGERASFTAAQFAEALRTLETWTPA